MAHHAQTLQYADEKTRPLFGLSFVEAPAVVVVYALAHAILPRALLRGVAPLIPAALTWLTLVLTHQVRVEPYIAQMYGFLVRRLFGEIKTKARVHTILEVDGFTRDALTEEDQDLRLVGRLQGLLAALGAGGALQLLVINNARDKAAIIAEERAAPAAPTPWLQELHTRSLMRLERGTVKQSNLRFYVVVYAPVRALPGLTRVTHGLGLDDADDVGIDDLVDGVRDTLTTMGLSARVVSAVADTGGAPCPKGETLTALPLSRGLHAASTYMLWPPGDTDPGFLDPLVALDGAYRLAVWITGTDPARERERLAMRQRQNGAALFAGLVNGKRPDVDAGAAVDETDAMILQLRRPEQGVVRCGVYLTGLGATPRDARRTVRRAITLLRQRIAARPATGLGHQQPLYQATLPGADTAHRAWRMAADTASNTYPFNRKNPTTPAGYRLGITDRGEDVRFDPEDESLRNALCVIVGLSGMGKTQLTLKVLKLHLLRHGRATILDRSGHYGPLGTLVHATTVRTAQELAATPIDTQMVIVDMRGQRELDQTMMDALDRRVQTVVGDRLHMFILEEAWQLEHLGAGLWVNDLARRGRHWAGFVWWITHEPEDLIKHPQIKSMFSAAATKIVFALDDKDGTATKIAGALGATPKEIQLIKSLPIGHCYLMRHNKTRGSIVRGEVNVQVDPDEQWLFESDPRSWQYKRREVEISTRDGDVWGAVRHLADTVPFAAEVDL